MDVSPGKMARYPSFLLMPQAATLVIPAVDSFFNSQKASLWGAKVQSFGHPLRFNLGIWLV